jgi:hypothetical protein
VRDDPPYLHDERLLTLDDTVEFFNMVLGDKLTAQEKQDLVASSAPCEFRMRIRGASRLRAGHVPCFGSHWVIRVRRAAQQCGNRDPAFDAGELGANAVVDSPAERQRAHVCSSDCVAERL